MNQNMKHEFAVADEIYKYLSENAKNIRIDTVYEIGSTNDEMKKRAASGEDEIAVLIAEHQTAGKGRRGRSFYSPEGTGIYMSILLRPDYPPEECTLLTTMAASSVARAIEGVTGARAQIKWVNDIFLNEKKVAGILTEVAVAPDRQKLSWAVVGIGINLESPEKGFPEELKEIAGSLLEEKEKGVKNRLIAEIINNFTADYQSFSERKYLRDYRDRLFFLNEEITVIEGDRTYKATAIDIDSMCHLKVRLHDGSEKLLFGGEISIRSNQGSSVVSSQ
ncbi:MAG: biotin--[Clostridia bacterium]|nr:biotin--[acetyl-CoA-carboxylase] ligase [Clostridia bacterium]